MLVQKDPLEAYLGNSRYIQCNSPAIMEVARKLRLEEDEEGTVRRAYEFVRDEIKHSWDVQDKRVTVTAEDVLREGVGICWAKANLLAAILRANGIPAGICYQRLTLGDTPKSGYCIHALNAVFLRSRSQWFRLDARGNKPGVCAEMNLEREVLAFQVREELGEVDYKTIHASPVQLTMDILENNTDALYMYLHKLPDRLPETSECQ